jgi:4-aminobutyrate aminotransferase/(S)-3-amino-2-methylpropionate transaminase
MDNTAPGSLGGTFGGNPLACEAALAAIQSIEDNHLNERAIELGDRFRTRAIDWQNRLPIIGDVRGLGAMQAFEIVCSDPARTPDPEATKKITRFCYEHGVILVTAGSYGNIIRLLMPLVITYDQMEEALDVLETALLHAHSGEPALARTPVAVA